MDYSHVLEYITSGEEKADEFQGDTEEIVMCLKEDATLGLYLIHHLLEIGHEFEEKSPITESIMNMLNQGDFDDSVDELSPLAGDSISAIIALIELKTSFGVCNNVIERFFQMREPVHHLHYRLQIMKCLLDELHNNGHHHMPIPWGVLDELVDDDDFKIFLKKDEVRYGIEAYIFDELDRLNHFQPNNDAVSGLILGINLMCSKLELEDTEEVATGYLSRYLHTLSQTCYVLVDQVVEEEEKRNLLTRSMHLLNAALINSENDETRQRLDVSAFSGSKVDDLPWEDISRGQILHLIQHISIILGGAHQ
jgi:hypothetical protein